MTVAQGEVPELVAAHLDALIEASPGARSPAGEPPEGFQVDGRGGVDDHLVALADQEATEAGKVGFRTADGGWVALHEMSHPHADNLC